MRQSLCYLTAWVIAVFLTGTSVSSAAPVLPDFSAATFVPGAPINNPYLPLIPGTLYTSVGQRSEDGSTAAEVDKVFVTSQTRNILGVPSRAVRDTLFVDGVLTEDTTDWFAQDTAGNVWYMGEFTTEFQFDDNGNVIGTSHEGSWLAGVNGAMPGFAMEVVSTIGDSYYQEFSAGVAEDQAEVVRLGETVTVPFGQFTNVLQTFETTALDPSDREFKFYAPGIGQILEEELGPNFEPTFASELVSVEVVPEPISVSMAALGVAGLAWIRRHAR